MNRNAAPLATTLTLLVFCVTVPLQAAEKSPITIQAEDGFELAADYFDPGRPGPGVLLLHQCNADRTMWDGIGRALAEAGHHVLALDYRGYGESKSEDADVDRADRPARTALDGFAGADVKSAFGRLTSLSSVDASKMATGGASCGGSRSINLAADVEGIRTMVFLSTGLSPEALETYESLREVPVLAITAENDGRTTSSLRELFRTSTNVDSRLVLYKGADHGHPLFQRDPKLEQTIVDWYIGHLQ